MDMDASTPLTSTSQFIQAGKSHTYHVKKENQRVDISADDDDDLNEDDIPGYSHPSPQVSPAPDKGKARQTDQLAPESGSPTPELSGNIGAPTRQPPNASRHTFGGVRVETRYTGVDTLDEPITTTIGRDLLSVWNKLIQVLYPRRKGGGREVLRDWDLWGPLFLCLLLAIMLSVNAPANQSLGTFTAVVVLICVGSLVVTIQAKLLGGRVSFFQGLCVLGYCVAPLDIAALISCFVRIIYVRAPIAILAWVWCIWASVNFLDGTKIEPQRILLAVYPLFQGTFLFPAAAYALLLRGRFLFDMSDYGLEGGTGQLISRLTNDEIDVAIALTDPLISGIAKGSKAYKLVGSYVTTPLNWAVITGKQSPYNDIKDLEGTKIGISRHGSGSQTMAYVMALQQGWPTDKLQFQVNNDIRGLIDSVNDGTTSAFMWEWFTTKPFLDAGEVRFIGSVPTPWPSWLIAAHPERAAPDALRTFLKTLSTYVIAFDAPEKRSSDDVEYIKEKFGYPEEDIKAWLKTVNYPKDCAAIPRKVVTETLDVLRKAGAIQALEAQPFNVEDFVDTNVARLV
ncbi:hypothetical protein EWM64_g2793 [Hericium alpestre]|uniref:Protein YIP n=1 Tax=Hericium alpestre TaxID=135208 RepID=A0A4Z0A4P7_9AGAM|nr:hypothetical protein EWM64_g2793 [Hericium alpestre]